ncbi:cobyrinate a,c-diamide synthase [Odoribacter sp. OttesenSCG-928-J03]|nr:cobyrinate a,c-diamide synthase [Odoribacter sp. OttesenSCG-928-J03]MDL2330537.1 cobyrinate a,c-diamide synthase [Odoribacter sp. OttesenSCG-928-A06]
MQSHFLIAAPSSNSGKTTITLGLLRALKNRGVKIQPFKCGPDYIDTKYHELASGHPSINLDSFFLSQEELIDLYHTYANHAVVAIVEGVMGLFDGYEKMQGSSAQMAEILNLPVILVVNAKSMAYSVAPLLYGFKNFYPNIRITGVIFNFVGSESHYQFLKEACEEAGLESLGYLPKDASVQIPSRHLGLNIDREYQFDEFAEQVAELIEKYIDIDRLLELTGGVTTIPNHHNRCVYEGDFKIAVAKDEAFNFVYYENIEHLKSLGHVVFFSPLNDSRLPEADFLYFPGGYPELYLEQLSHNTPMLNDIRIFAEDGGKILAECGGMMYLSSSISDEYGHHYPMVGVLKQTATMEHMKLKLGYRKFECNGLEIRGHEFHYSTLNTSLETEIQQYNAKNMPVDTKLIRYKNVIAGYTHIYWGNMNNILDLF